MGTVVTGLIMLAGAAAAWFFGVRLKGEPSQEKLRSGLNVVAVIVGSMGLVVIAFAVFISWIENIREGD